MDAAQLGVGSVEACVQAADFLAQITDIGLGGGRGGVVILGGDASGGGEGEASREGQQLENGFHGETG